MFDELAQDLPQLIVVLLVRLLARARPAPPRPRPLPPVGVGGEFLVDGVNLGDVLVQGLYLVVLRRDLLAQFVSCATRWLFLYIFFLVT